MQFSIFRQGKHENYDGKAQIAKMASHVEGILKSKDFDGSDPNSTLSSLSAVSRVYGRNEIHKDAILWLFHVFTKKLDGAAHTDANAFPAQPNCVREVSGFLTFKS